MTKEELKGFKKEFFGDSFYLMAGTFKLSERRLKNWLYTDQKIPEWFDVTFRLWKRKHIKDLIDKLEKEEL